MYIKQKYTSEDFLLMTKKEKLQQIHDLLYSIMGECTCPLIHADAYQLLIAVMLSAQCKDDRVNQVTKILFALAPDAKKMAELDVRKIEEIIHPCGLSKNKSRNIHSTSKMLIEKYSGVVPKTMDELTSLPGIGRKSANVVLGNAFGIPGFPVDTHVKRVLFRLGTTKSQNPEVIEKEVCKVISDELWTNFSHLLIQHGRKICSAAKPKCDNCTLNKICSKKGVSE